MLEVVEDDDDRPLLRELLEQRADREEELGARGRRLAEAEQADELRQLVTRRRATDASSAATDSTGSFSVAPTASRTSSRTGQNVIPSP